jgi:hypothetical protein
MSEEGRKRDEKVLKVALNNLTEYFDTVQIFVTRHEAAEENGTLEYNCGAGNYYARLGQVKVWQDTQADGTFFWNEDGDDDDDDLGF